MRTAKKLMVVGVLALAALGVAPTAIADPADDLMATIDELSAQGDELSRMASECQDGQRTLIEIGLDRIAVCGTP